ncbi:MAG: hypothetical protein ACMG6H_17355, partial [Acidobacteriota bacterium]
NNVMDEVSYALEARKLVVPILLRSGSIPFRLRRVQHVDFTTGYDSGFAQLLRALHIEQQPAGTSPTAPRHHYVAPPVQQPQRPPARVEKFEVPRAGTMPAPTTRTPAPEPVRQAPAVPTFLSGNVQPKKSLHRLLSALILAALGAIWGAGVFITYESREFPVGAAIVGIAGAVTGLITGKRLGVIALALGGMILGFVLWTAAEGGTRFGVIQGGVFGVSLGGIAGALVGLIISKLWGRARR